MNIILTTECIAAGTFILNSKGLKDSEINEMYEFCISALKRVSR